MRIGGIDFEVVRRDDVGIRCRARLRNDEGMLAPCSRSSTRMRGSTTPSASRACAKPTGVGLLEQQASNNEDVERAVHGHAPLVSKRRAP